jgi:hypothetical protein
VEKKKTWLRRPEPFFRREVAWWLHSKGCGRSLIKGGKVIRNYIRATAVATVCSGAVLGAQAGQGSQAQQPQAQSTMESKTAATLEGCVYREKDVPGRAPNVAERAGILEDYILAEVTPKQPQGTPSTGTPGATGTSGAVKAGAMYKLEKIEDEKLRAMVGKRVEVTGKIDAEAGDKTATPATPPTTQTDRAIGRDRIDLPEFEVTSIREVSGTCPAKPSVR